MKAFVYRLLWFFLIQLSIWVWVLRAYVRHPTNEKDFLSATILKHDLLDRQPSPRLIFVGGSNVAFGLDSESLGRGLGYNPVNMGLKVTLGLDFMLEEVEPALRPGDVVVISPEYDLFGRTARVVAGQTIFVVLEERPENVRYLSPATALQVLDNGYQIAGQMLSEAIDSHVYVENSENAYRRDAFNRYGDLVAHYRLGPRGFVFENIDSSTDETNIRWVIDRLNRFQELCERRGVRVFYSHPPCARPWCDKNRVKIAEIEAALNRDLRIPMLDHADEMCSPLDDFFDSQYHLDENGTKIRSQHLLESLTRAGVNRAPR